MVNWTFIGLVVLGCCFAAQAQTPQASPSSVMAVPPSPAAKARRQATDTGSAASKQTDGMQAGAEMRWEVKASDVTLARTLERWAHDAGHKLKWDASRNFLIGASDVYLGSFEGAIEQVLSSPGIRYSEYPLEACIYANTPPLVRITRQGEQSRECVAATAR